MGSGRFDYTSSSTRSAVRSSTGASAFAHAAAAARGAAPKLHETLDVTKKPHRESRDSVDNPNSTPIAILCDVTGSMGTIPEMVIKDLHKLMKMILEKGVVTDPHMCFGAIGDATCDSVPVQLGEFEADDELAEQHLSNIYHLERGGGGQVMESYELFMWFFGNRVDTDAYDKRGEKGYLYIIGDEAPYSTVRADLLKEWMGIDDVEEDMSLQDVARQVQQKFNVFCIRPGGSSHFHSDDVQGIWESILPVERVIKVEKWEDIVPMIAGSISVMAGASISDTIAALKDADFDDSAIDMIANSLVPLENTSVPVVMEDGALASADDAVAHGEKL